MKGVPANVYAFAIAALAIVGEVVCAVTKVTAPGSLSVALYAALGGALGISLPTSAVSTVPVTSTSSTGTIPRSG